MRARLFLLTFASILACATSAATASAANFCVGTSAHCLGAPSNSFPATEQGLESALADAEAASTADTIYIAAGDPVVVSKGLSIHAPEDNPVTITGEGTHDSTLSFTNQVGVGLDIDTDDGENSSVSSLIVRVGGPVATGDRTGIRMEKGTVSDVNFIVDGESDTNEPTSGLTLKGGGLCTYCDFAMLHDRGIGLETTVGGRVTLSRFRDASGADDETVGIISGGPGSVNVRQSRFVELGTSVNVRNGGVQLYDSAIDMGGHDDATGVVVNNPDLTANHSSATINGATIVGDGDDQTGIDVEAATNKVAGEYATVTLWNSLLLLAGTSATTAYCADDGSLGIATFNSGFSYLKEGTPTSSGCSSSSTSDTFYTSASPYHTFVNWDAGDLRLKPTADAQIDKGDPDTPKDDRGYDLILSPRFQDGSNSGTATIDIGAYEYGPYAPDTPQVSASATTVETGTAVDFQATGFDANGDVLSYAWDFDDGSSSSEQNPTHVFSKAGTFTVEVRTNDGALASLPASVTITVTAPAAPSGPKSDCCQAGAGRVSFAKTSAKFKFTKKQKLGNGFAVSTKKPKGASYKVTTEGSWRKLNITLTNSKGKKLKGSQTVTFPQGTSYLTFRGGWNKKPLPKGTYYQRLIDIGTNTLVSKLTLNNSMPSRLSMTPTTT
ncbi:MAG: PKD domain-containing protein [Solirubrobacterales bacterium]